MVTAEYIIENNISTILAKKGNSVYEIKLQFPMTKGETFSVYHEGDYFDGYVYDSLETFLENWDSNVYGNLEYV